MKYKLVIVLALIILACIYLGRLCYNYYSPAKERIAYQTAHYNDDTLRIAYAGDSWAVFHQQHPCVLANILFDSIQCPVTVHSYGVCGLTSKEIYEQIFDNSDFRHFLQERNYDYCFVSAGINDTYKKMSTSYYKQSMDCLIKFLTNNHIHPIILEIPDYDIQKSYDRQKPSRKVLRQLSMMINKTQLDCKQDFRTSLDELIDEKRYQDKVSIVRYKSWNPDYQEGQEELYLNDGLHLNSHGYAVLDSVIASEILLGLKLTFPKQQ